MTRARITSTYAIVALAFVARLAGQSTNSRLSIAIANSNLTLSWTGRGTLQAAADADGPWRDLLEASSPFRSGASNAHEFYRSISRWSTRHNLLEANSEMAVAELNGKIYVMGGYPSSRVTMRTVQVYDSQSNQWHLTTPLPIPLNHAMPAVANGRVYLIGGQTDSSGTGSYTNTVFEYNPATSNWTSKAAMPTSRSAGAAAVIGNFIYVAGGRPPQGQDFAVYDTVSNAWSVLPLMPTARNHLAAAVLDGKIYVAGGRLGAGFGSEMTAALEAYDPLTRTWTARAPLLAPRGGVNGIAIDDCFFVFGGEGPNGVFANNEMYVASQNRWYRVESLPVAVHGVTGAAFINGWIHLPGGGTAVGGSSGSLLHQVFWVGGLCP
jgi:N-acetylneuraminic acid mutarotase